MATINRFRITKSGNLVFYRPDSQPSGTTHDLSELTAEHGNMSLKRVKGHYHYGSSINLRAPARRALKRLGINTLGELVAGMDSDDVKETLLQNAGCYGGREFVEACISTLSEYRNNLCDPDFIAPVRMTIRVDGVGGYHSLEGDLKKIVNDEVGNRITHILPEIIRDAEHIKNQREIKETQSRIAELKQRLAVLEMDT